MEMFKRRRAWALAAGLLIASGFATATDAWRWRENGRWVYGDKFPPGALSPERFAPLSAGPRLASPPIGWENEQAAKAFPVIIYGVGCPGCEAAKKLMERRGVPAQVKDPAKAEVYDEFKALSPQSLAPVIVVGERSLVGFDEEAINAALDEAGYKKLAPIKSGPSPKAADPVSK